MGRIGAGGPKQLLLSRTNKFCVFEFCDLYVFKKDGTSDPEYQEIHSRRISRYHHETTMKKNMASCSGEVVLFGKTYKWNKAECGSCQFLDLRLMEENEMEELKKIIVLNDKGVTCFEHKEHGWIPLEPHCIECGRRLINDNVLFAFGYVTEFADQCKNESDYCVCKRDEIKELCSTCHINGSRVLTSCPDCGVVIFGDLSDSGKVERLKNMKEQTRIDIANDFKEIGVNVKKKKF